MGVRVLPSDRADHDQGVQAARAQLSEDGFEAAWSYGSALSSQQAVDLGLSVVEPALYPGVRRSRVERAVAVGSSASVGPLTTREQEVAIPVAQGLTNHEIAERLVVSDYPDVV